MRYLTQPPGVRVALALLLLSGAVVVVSSPGPPFSENDRAYYLEANQVNFIRPGLVIAVSNPQIAADGTLTIRVKLTDPRGLPLDREGITTPGTINTSFIAACIPKGQSQYVSYTTRTQTSPITRVSAVQAAADSGGTYTKLADGEYTYRFGTKLPSGFDRTATHTIGAYGSRNLSEFDLGTQYYDTVFHFVPDGSKVSVVRDVIKTATCNACHYRMGFHGGSRRSMELCVLCHTPQTVDPDTGNTVDMPVMTHKIHMGSQLPSVRAGKKYQIIGNAQVVHDYSAIVFTADPRTCSACHKQDASQAANVYKANREACGACHDDVNFATGAGHVNLPQFTDNQCTTCHTMRGELEFDASIQGAHTIPRLSRSLPGIVFDILSVDDAAPGKNPTVTFSVKDRSGKPIRPADMSRLNLLVAGPTSDYSAYWSEDVRAAEGPGDGRYFWTLIRALPANASGTWSVGIEGRRDLLLLEGTTAQVSARDSGANKVFSFSVDGSKAVPRRTVVSLAKCNACHNALAFHGDSRNAIEQCVLCHNPTLRAGSGAQAVSVDFRLMIHKIHMGSSLTRDYTIGSRIYRQKGYPGERGNCDACHVNDSQQLPLARGLLEVADPNGPLNPLPPASAACLSCHDSLQAAQHAQANTTAIGESCAACHGRDREFSVNRVHAR